jgi:hypothetical protein
MSIVFVLSKPVANFTFPSVAHSFLYARAGWPQEKTDDLVVPVLRQLTTPLRQTRVEEFFPPTITNARLAAKRGKKGTGTSKRAEKALAKIRKATAK